MDYKYENVQFSAETVAGMSLTAFVEQNKGSFFLNVQEEKRIEMLAEVHESCLKLLDKPKEPHAHDEVHPVQNVVREETNKFNTDFLKEHNEGKD